MSPLALVDPRADPQHIPDLILVNIVAMDVRHASLRIDIEPHLHSQILPFTGHGSKPTSEKSTLHEDASQKATRIPWGASTGGSRSRQRAHRRLRVRLWHAIDPLPRHDQQALYGTIDAFLKSAADA